MGYSRKSFYPYVEEVIFGRSDPLDFCRKFRDLPPGLLFYFQETPWIFLPICEVPPWIIAFFKQTPWIFIEISRSPWTENLTSST